MFIFKYYLYFLSKTIRFKPLWFIYSDHTLMTLSLCPGRWVTAACRVFRHFPEKTRGDMIIWAFPFVFSLYFGVLYFEKYFKMKYFIFGINMFVFTFLFPPLPCCLDTLWNSINIPHDKCVGMIQHFVYWYYHFQQLVKGMNISFHMFM